MKRPQMMAWGLALVIVGVVVILIQAGTIPWNGAWWLPALFLGLGLFFHMLFFVGGMRDCGLLVPGGIMLTYGVLTSVSTALGGDWLLRLSGLWIAGPALGIAEMKLASRGREGSWGTVAVLLSIAVAVLLVMNAHLSFATLMGAVLIIWGAAAILKELFHKEKPHTPEKETNQQP